MSGEQVYTLASYQDSSMRGRKEKKSLVYLATHIAVISHHSRKIAYFHAMSVYVGHHVLLNGLLDTTVQNFPPCSQDFEIYDSLLEECKELLAFVAYVPVKTFRGCTYMEEVLYCRCQFLLQSEGAK